MADIAPDFKRFMGAVYNSGKDIDDQKVAKFLFEGLKSKYTDDKYGFDLKTAIDNFRRMLCICIRFKDYDFVFEIWRNMERFDKDWWWEGAHRIPDLETFFSGDRYLHNYFRPENPRPVCCDYCLFLNQLQYVNPSEIDELI